MKLSQAIREGAMRSPYLNYRQRADALGRAVGRVTTPASLDYKSSLGAEADAFHLGSASHATEYSVSMLQATRERHQGHCQRIAAPGKWKVWREGDAVKHERTGQ